MLIWLFCGVRSVTFMVYVLPEQLPEELPLMTVQVTPEGNDSVPASAPEVAVPLLAKV